MTQHAIRCRRTGFAIAMALDGGRCACASAECCALLDAAAASAPAQAPRRITCSFELTGADAQRLEAHAARLGMSLGATARAIIAEVLEDDAREHGEAAPKDIRADLRDAGEAA